MLFSHQAMSDSLRPRGLQHARPSCPSPSPGVCASSHPPNWWCHSTILSSVTLFSVCPQSFLASESFPVSQLFASGDQSIGASASESVLPVNIQGWFPLGLTSLIFLQSRGFSRVAPATQFKSINSSVLSFLYGQTVNRYMTTAKTVAFTIWTFVSTVMSAF